MAYTKDELRVKQLVSIGQTQQVLNNIHCEVAGLTSSSRRRLIEQHNRKTNVQPVNYTIGDFVLVRRSNTGRHKLAFVWQGPQRVTAAKSELVYEVESLVSGKVEIVHARRLRLYRAGMDGKEVAKD